MVKANTCKSVALKVYHDRYVSVYVYIYVMCACEWIQYVHTRHCIWYVSIHVTRVCGYVSVSARMYSVGCLGNHLLMHPSVL